MKTDPDSYDAAAQTYVRYAERTTIDLTRCLLEMVHLQLGNRLLDVACGSGTVSLRAAEVVGSRGQVIGVDLSPGQLEMAERRRHKEGTGWLQFKLMDAMALDFSDGHFDAVVAQFPHLPDRKQCIGEMVRVLRSGGRLAICNGGGGAPPWPLKSPEGDEVPAEALLDGVFYQILRVHAPQFDVPAPAGNAPKEKDTTQSRLRRELEEAGLGDITLWSGNQSSAFETAEDIFEWECVRNSPFRMNRSEIDDEAFARFKTAYLLHAEGVLADFQILGLSTGALFGTGKKI